MPSSTTDIIIFFVQFKIEKHSFHTEDDSSVVSAKVVKQAAFNCELRTSSFSIASSKIPNLNGIINLAT